MDFFDTKKVRIVTITNPFKPYEREILVKDWKEGKGLDYYTGYLPTLSDVELIASVNGKLVEDWGGTDINPGDYIAVCPIVGGGKGGKKILRIVGMIAVMFVAHFAAPALAPGVSSFLGVGLETAKWLVGGLINLVGTMILNAVVPPPTPDLPHIGRDSWNESPTYSWSVLKNTQVQGLPIPILYGTHRVAGQVISKNVDIVGKNQYLNVLVAVCGHEVDSISSIQINGQPASYFRGVTTYTRLGTATDTVIPNFNEVATQQTFGSKLNYNSAVTYQTDGNSVEKIKVYVEAPQGCYYANDQGGLDQRTATFQVEYREVGGDTWTTVGTYSITGATTTSLSKTVTFDTPSAAQYEVRITRTNTESSDARERTAIYWVAMTEIIKRALIYPGIAKYAVRALATDQLSGGEPTYTALVTRSTVQVYNPSTSSWESKSADNPAWAAYDLLVNDVYGMGIDHTRIIYDDFASWASYCDETVQSEKRFTLNLYIDTTMTAWEALLHICSCGRAVPVRRGTKYTIIVDKDDTPVQLYTQASVSNFSVTYLPKKDRSNAIEVTYIDEDRDYTRQTVAVYSSDYNDSSEPDSKQSMRLFGCTRRTQAIREGAYRLNATKYLHRTIEFEVDIEALATQVGDIFNFQHETLMFGDGYAGRVIESTSTTVTLDNDIVPKLGATNKVSIRHNDDTIEEKTISSFTYKDNLVTNGNFERDTTGTMAPEGWTKTDTGTPTKAEVYATSTDESGGDSPWWRLDAHTYDVSGDSSNRTSLQTTNFITVDETSHYDLNLWVKNESGSSTISLTIACYDSTDTFISNIDIPVANVEDEWHQLSYIIHPSSETSETYHFPTNTAEVKITVDPLVSSSSSSEMLFSRIQLVQGQQPADWLTVLTVDSSWTTNPEEYAPYATGESTKYIKPYRCIDISRGHELKKRIRAIEHISAIYTDTGYVFTQPSWDIDYQEATKVFLHEFLTWGPDGTYKSNIGVSWHSSLASANYSWHIWLGNLSSQQSEINVTGENNDSGDGVITSFSYTLSHLPVKSTTYVVHYTIGGTAYSGTSDANGNITGTNISSGTIDYDTAEVSITFSAAPDSGTNITSDYTYYDPDNPILVGQSDTLHFDIPSTYLTLGHKYKVFVVQLGQGATELAGNTAVITIEGEFAPPADVTTFSGTYNSITRNVDFTWSAISDIDLDHYEIRKGGTTWADATTIIEYAYGTSASWYVSDTTNDTIRFWIKAVDKVGEYSQNATYTDVVINTSSTPLQVPTGLTLTSYSETAGDGTDRVYLRATWNNNAEASDKFHHYNIRLVKEPSGTGYTSQYDTTNTEYLWEVMPNTEYGVYLRAVDISGNSTNWTTMASTTTAKDSSAPATVQWQATNPVIPGFKVMGLHWQKNSEYDIAQYHIQRADDSGFSTNVEDKYSQTNFFTDSGLDVSATYYYRLKAVDTSGNESASWSTTQSGTTLQVGSADIAYNSITANHIDVSQLSAISADVGTLTAGTIQSGNWGSSAGTKLYLPDGTLYIGGSSDPKLSWNGTTLAIEGEVTVTGGSGVSNFSDLPLPLANLLQNPGFEDSTNPDWWTLKDSSVSIETTGGNNSNYWMKITRSGTNLFSLNADGKESTARRYFEVNEGEIYEFGGDVKTDGTCVGVLAIMTLDKDKANPTYHYNSGSPTTWTSWVYRYTIQSGEKYISFYVGADTNDGWAGFDNLYLRKIDSLSADWGHSSDITKIDGGKIYTDSITATQLIKTAALITQSAQIDTGIIETAHIQDAAIETAKIKDANITTLKVAGDAITAPVSSYTSGSIYVSMNWTTIQQLTVAVPSEVSSQPIMLVFSATMDLWSGSFDYRLLRGSTTIWSSSSAYSSIASAYLNCGCKEDSPGAGTYTYYFQSRNSMYNDSRNTATERAMWCILCKR